MEMNMWVIIAFVRSKQTVTTLIDTKIQKMAFSPLISYFLFNENYIMKYHESGFVRTNKKKWSIRLIDLINLLIEIFEVCVIPWKKYM